MNKKLLGCAILSLAMILVGCGTKEDPFVVGCTFNITKTGRLRLEAEHFDVSEYGISGDNKTAIVEDKNASGGKYIAGSALTKDDAGTLTFELNLSFASELTFNVAYAQTESYKANELDMSNVYTYLIDENRSMSITTGKTLFARSDIGKYQKITYDTITLPKGIHKIDISLKEDSPSGTPSIDYIDLDVVQILEHNIPIDINGVPSNDFHTPVQYAYANDLYTNIYDYGKGTAEDSAPRGIICNFDDVEDAETYYIEKASMEDFSDSKIFTVDARNYAFQNLKLGETLHYRVAASREGLASARIRTVKVATQAPRNVKVDGIHNFRDIGGWISDLVPGGVAINQGLFYRCARFDTVTEEGKDTIINDLGITVEIDMRDSYQCTGPYIAKSKGDAIDVKYVPASIPSGTEKNRFSGYNDVWRKIFTEIANQDGAIALHCTAGADRTGLAAYFLLTLLGASYEDVARDYLYTNLSDQGVRYIDDTHMELWETSLLKYEGDTRAEKCKNVLLEKGVTEDEIETIRERYVPGY